MRSGVLLSTQVLVQQGGVCLNLLVKVCGSQREMTVSQPGNKVYINNGAYLYLAVVVLETENITSAT